MGPKNQEVVALLEGYSRLAPADQHEVEVEILRRASDRAGDELTDEDLALLADELFLELDRREADDAQA